MDKQQITLYISEKEVVFGKERRYLSFSPEGSVCLLRTHLTTTFTFPLQDDMHTVRKRMDLSNAGDEILQEISREVSEICRIQFFEDGKLQVDLFDRRTCESVEQRLVDILERGLGCRIQVVHSALSAST